MSTKIQEVFGQYAIQIDGAIKMFDNEEDAAVALSAAQNGEQNRSIANDYCDHMGWLEKNKANKSNIITAFLNWADSTELVADSDKVIDEPSNDTASSEVIDADDKTEAPASAEDLGDDEITF